MQPTGAEVKAAFTKLLSKKLVAMVTDRPHRPTISDFIHRCEIPEKHSVYTEVAF